MRRHLSRIAVVVAAAMVLFTIGAPPAGAAAPTVATTPPGCLTTGDAATEFTVRVQDVDMEPEDVLIKFTFTGLADIEVADLTLEYENPADTWTAVTLTESAPDTLTGTAPAGGIATTDNFDQTYTFRVAVADGAPTGQLDLLTEIVAEDDGTVLSNDNDPDIEVVDGDVALTEPAALARGAEEEPFPATVTACPGSTFAFTFSALDGLDAGEVELSFTDDDEGGTTTVPLTQQPDGTITGVAAVPVEADDTTEALTFVVKFGRTSPTGSVTLTTDLVAPNGTTVDTDSGAIQIVTPTISVTAPEGLQPGDPAEPLTITVDNPAGGGDYDRVRVDLLFDAVSPLTTDDIVFECSNATVALEQGTGGDADNVIAMVGALSGMPMVAGASTTYNCTLALGPDAPAGETLTITGQLFQVNAAGNRQGNSIASTTDTTATETPPTDPGGGGNGGVVPPGGGPGVAGPGPGYRMVAADGGIFTFGDREFWGSTGSMILNKPIVGGATDPSDFEGYWIVASDGGVFTFGADFFGSLGSANIQSPAVEIEPTPSGKGYWIVLANGTVHPFGDAQHQGDMAGKPLNQPIIGMSVTSTGLGYWLVGRDGGIFSFGDASFFGSTGSMKLNAPVIDLAPMPGDQGYYLVAADGGVFTFGTALFKGSTGSMKLNAPVLAMLVAPNGAGYWLAASDGGVFTFGNVDFLGSMGGTKLNAPVLDLIY